MFLEHSDEDIVVFDIVDVVVMMSGDEIGCPKFVGIVRIGDKVLISRSGTFIAMSEHTLNSAYNRRKEEPGAARRVTLNDRHTKIKIITNYLISAINQIYCRN